MESGGLKREPSCTCHSTHTADPKKKRCNLTSLTGSDTTFPPQQEEEKNPACPVTAQPTGNCHNSANEKSLYFKGSIFSNKLFVYNIPSQMHKSVFLSFVSLDLVCGSPLNCIFQIEICLLFLNKPILVKACLAVYLFKVSSNLYITYWIKKMHEENK